MRVDFICISLVLGLLCIARSASSAAPIDPFLGISPQDEKFYRSSDTIACRGGSKKFTRAQLNDDFCDCPDGTDEPGTSACPGGKFYCKNAGHAPLLIFSSRVNDGLCDCCDGSDEYDGSVKCANTCWEAGKVARDKLEKKIATYQEGVTIRKHDIEQAKLTTAKDEAELSKLKSEEKILKGIVEQLKDRKEEIEKAEEKERLRKEKEEKEKKEAEEKANHKEVEQGKEEADEKADSKDNPVESTVDDDIGIVEDSLSDQHAGDEKTVLPEESKEDSAVESKVDLDPELKEPLDEVKKVENDESKNTEGLSSEELGRLVASRWTGENSGKQSEESDVVKDDHHLEDDNDDDVQIPEDAPHEEYDHYASDSDDDHSKYDSYDGGDDDVEDETHEDHSEPHEYSSSYTDDFKDESDFKETTTPTWWEKIRQTARSILKAVDPFKTPVDISEGDRVRKEYEESSAKLSKMQSRISSLTEKLKLDFGPEKEFFSFYDRCFEGKQSKYVYKVCPYKHATQMEGHSNTRLGNWDKFEQSHKIMLFSNGDKCWNGPDRSLKVKLRCGLKNEVTDVDEPSRCEYVALLATPALCSEEKLKELKHQLEVMNKDQPRSHDEL